MSETEKTVQSARLRLKKRLEVAFKRKDLELRWEIPDEWGWFLDDPETYTKCRKLKTEQEIRHEIATFCPRVLMGEIPSCLHVEEVVRLYADNWGVAAFLTRAPTGVDNYPIVIPEHWHRDDAKVFVVKGKGVVTVDGVSTEMYSQDIIDIPAGAISQLVLEHPTRAIKCYRTKNGEPSYMG